MLEGERLIAAHGLQAVSLRQVAMAAGTANTSAVAYHFGSKDGLVRAILEYRLPGLIQQRALLRAKIPVPTLRQKVECHLLPVIDLAETEGSHYLTFLEQLQQFGPADHPFARLRPELRRSNREFVQDLAADLTHLPPPLRALRVQQVNTLSLHSAADRERFRLAGAEHLPFGLYANNLLDTLTAVLLAPASSATQNCLDALPGANPTEPSVQPVPISPIPISPVPMP